MPVKTGLIPIQFLFPAGAADMGHQSGGYNDPPDARIVLHPRLCAVGEFDWLLPMAPLEEGD